MILKRGFGSPIVVWSHKNADQYFFIATDAMVATKITSVLVALFIFNTTGFINVQVGFQESDDGETWPAQTSFSVIPAFYANADGSAFDNEWQSVTFTKRFVRFGFVVKNDSGNDREFAYCALRLDTRGNA